MIGGKYFAGSFIPTRGTSKPNMSDFPNLTPFRWPAWLGMPHIYIYICGIICEAGHLNGVRFGKSFIFGMVVPLVGNNGPAKYFASIMDFSLVMSPAKMT